MPYKDPQKERDYRKRKYWNNRQKESDRKKKYREKNKNSPEYIAQTKRHNLKNKGNREKWQKEHPEKMKEFCKRKYQKNREEILMKARKYRQENKNPIRAEYSPKNLKCIICGNGFIGKRSFAKYCPTCNKKTIAKRQYECKKKWRNNNIEKRRKISNADYHSDKGRNRWLKYNYGITIQEYVKLIEIQKGCCAICGKPETTIKNGRIIRLHVDHNHKTGRIRGLLCSKCNMSIGLCMESKEILLSMIDYLEKNNGNT